MVLVVDSLTVRRGERTILEVLSLSARAGTAVLLTGPNGAGKTTLLRAIAGLIRHSGGIIRLEGAGDGQGAGGLHDADDGIARLCHLVGHLNGHRGALTVRENAGFWSRYLGGDASLVAAALDRFRLAELASVPASYLSAGQKRRLGLVRLLLAPRPVWLLDEPAVSLDAASRDLLATVVNGHLAAGGIVIAATHQPLGFSPVEELRLGGARSTAGEASAAATDGQP